MHRIHPRHLFSALALCVLAAVAFNVSPLIAKSTIPDASDKYRETTRDAVDKLNRAHYAAVKLDDQLSTRLFDAYLEALDPTRNYLLADDVKQLQGLRSTLDDQLARGDVDAAFEIYHVFHDRVASRLASTLDDLDATIAAFDFTIDESIPRDSSTLPWAKDMAEADDRWRKRLKNDVLNLRLAKKEPAEIPDVLRKRYEYQLKRFEQTNEDDIYAVFMNTYAQMYDPHTSYFSPRQMENFRISMSRSLEGIGAVLTQEFEHTKVLRLVPGGPAARAGKLRAADRIIAVGQGLDGDMINVVGWRLDEVVDNIRGAKDTWVRLEVLPAAAELSGKTEIISIQRGKVELEDQLAKAEVLDVFHNGEVHKVGLIDVPDFYADFDGMRNGDPDYRSTTRDVAALLEDLQRQQVEGLIIDLRDNAGGSLAEANSLVGLFIESGPTVQIRSANNQVQRQGKSRPSSFYDGPLVVIINRLSASASEIFAGAIQDYGRGLVVGSTSFGKGTVQGLLPLPEGQLKMTGSKFYRVSGQSTQNRGVEPDIAFPNLYDPEEIGESTLDGALPWDIINPAPHARYQDYSVVSSALSSLSTRRADSDPDLVYLRDQYDLAAEYRHIDEITLNEAKRLAQREETEVRRLAIENKRRLAKGLEPLDKLAEEESAEDPELAAAEADDTGEESEEKSAEDDALAIEAARILLDSKQILHQLATGARGMTAGTN